VSRLAAFLAGLALTALILGLVVRAANGSLPPLTDESWVLIPLAVGLPIVGAAIARPQPRHPIAWIFLGSGLGAGLAMFSYEYGHYALITKPGSVPLGVAVAWVSEWMWTTAAIPLLTFGLLLFPDGHLPSRRWRPVAWLAGATLAMFMVGPAVLPGLMPGYPDIPNPVGIEAARPL
jgi:two-component system, NarL family, sensor kinase